MKKMKSISLLLGVTLLLSITGCGGETQQSTGQDITLIDPVNTAAAYEEAAYRDLYEAEIYAATVVPYTEEFSCENNMVFDHFGAYPGEEVKAGQTLIYSNTDSFDREIESLEKQIENLDNGYEEYKESIEEQLADQRERLNGLQSYMDAYNANPSSYNQAVADKQLIGPYRTTEHAINTLELGLSQRTELYKLDRAHYINLLNNVKNNKKENTIESKMSGTLVGINALNQGDYIAKDITVAAVGDLDQKLLKCQYLNATTVKKAADIYALVNGKRYEVEHHAMEPTEYVSLTSKGETVYATFSIIDENNEVNIGDYAVIVMVKDERDNVLSIPKAAIQRDDNGSFVYLIKDGIGVQTYITLGMSDDAYTEILSGLSEGDKIMIESSGMTGSSTVKLQKGRFDAEYESRGSMQYPNSTIAKNPIQYGTVYYVGTDITPFQYVEKGDVLATVRVVKDEIALERNELKKMRLQERIADLKKLDEEANQKSIQSMQEQIADLDEIIADQIKDFTTTEIKAETSGIVVNYWNYAEEDILTYNCNLYTIADATTCYIGVDNSKQLLQYGNKVNIAYQNAQEEECVAQGTVVSLSSMATSASMASDYSYVLVPEDKIAEMLEFVAQFGNRYWRGWFPYDVTASVRVMDNVVVVPKKAVTDINGNTYVSVKEESGKIVKRSFISGGFNSDFYWVVDGLTEGMEICLE